MHIYNTHDLNRDITSGKISYSISNYADIREKELRILAHEELGFAHVDKVDRLKKNLLVMLKPLQNYFPRTYSFLQQQSLEYRVFFQWYGLGDNVEGSGVQKDRLFSEGYFVLNNRVYFVRPKSYSFNLPNYLQTWHESIGGISCSDYSINANGRMLIDDAWLWHSFDEYIVKNKKKVIEHIVNTVPYTFVARKRPDRSMEEINLKKGFPNLRCFLDTRMPFDSPDDIAKCKEYDLLFVCYDFNETVYLVKDGDFINGLYTIDNPAEALDNYMLHVFSQYDQEFTRFDFSPWMQKI